ncbi:adenylate/guanylate cyclase domain-containing protein [Desertibaculum subflavum]|uniref:adenylate/guanylate cyclase domain-containing protein n=1 Tax=Desertibaculum subflavum TaxID=2268458 RepID=UPI000E66F5A0
MGLDTLAREHRAAFRRAEIEGLKLAFYARAVAVAAISTFLIVFSNYYTAPLYHMALLLALLGLGGLSVLAARRGWPAWTFYVGAALDAALVAFAILYPNPFDPEDILPPAARFKFDNSLYLLVLVAHYALSFSARLVLWVGASAAAAWLGAALWVMSQPGFGPRSPAPEPWIGAPDAQRLVYLTDPWDLRVLTLSKQMILLGLVTGTVALGVARARRLVARQAEAERGRANLARYVSPNVTSLSAVKGPTRATAAILFVDIVGFTRFTEEVDPEHAVELLRDFFRHVAPCVGSHGGTLDKYLGDGLMATFGLPVAGKRDAVDALAAARDMAQAVTAWNAERVATGQPTVKVGIGVHWGPVVLTEIGGEHRVELATLGDTVNVASRLQEATRGLDVAVVISGALRWAVLSQADLEEAITLLDGFLAQPPVQLRGRAHLIEIWTLA